MPFWSPKYILKTDTLKKEINRNDIPSTLQGKITEFYDTAPNYWKPKVKATVKHATKLLRTL